MKARNFLKLFVVLFVVILCLTASFAQRKKRGANAPKTKPIIFAVLNDGKTLEPIAEIDGGKLQTSTGGDAELKVLNSFAASYYKPKTKYDLIFGGAKQGSVTVLKSDPKSGCAKNMADAATVSTKAKIKGLVMALATNAASTKNASGLRRLPTAAERAEIEKLVRAEFANQKVSAGAVKNMKYHNLTAIDTDNDKTVEFVGSFWTETGKDERALLFFIAEKGQDGKYDFGYSEFKKISQSDLMEGADIKSLDTQGILNELLLDLFDFDGGNSAEIFTLTQGFESNSFNVYGKSEGKWTKVFEASNYHCGF